MKVRRTVTSIVVLFAMALMFFAGFAAAGQWRMHDAKRDLEAARGHLQSAEPDKAGHRVQAIELVNQALTQVNEGIRAGR